MINKKDEPEVTEKSEPEIIEKETIIDKVNKSIFKKRGRK